MLRQLLTAFLLLVPLALQASPLVTPAWLKAQAPGSLTLVDTRPTPMYGKGHLPGAVSADLFRHGPLPVSREQLEQRWRSWGLRQSGLIVIYDEGGSWQATELFHSLLSQGVPAERLRVLDGGATRWRAEGGALSTEAVTPAPGDLRLGAENPAVKATLPEFLSASGDGRSAIVAALDANWQYGGLAFFGRAGHVPGAQMLPNEDLFNADKTFKSPSEIAKLMAHLGIDAKRPVQVYCGGGQAATATWFAISQVAGHPQAKVFSGSLLEWVRDPRGLPLNTYAQPQLLREPAWVKTWNGGMLRGYGVAEMTVVDVREPDEFALSHLRHALNLPGSQLRSLSPAQLAERLRTVEPRHEAVIVSAGGLNREAALAWLALRRAGQRQVTLLLEGADRWGPMGFDLGDAPPPPAARGAREVQPALFTPSSDATPVHMGDTPPAGGGLHLPWRSLVDAQGRPLPAAALWQQIRKAGVPRYRPLRITADDAGDAAAGLFLLELMGMRELSVR
jgi:3-mercaptopyruvate sulfurtransferase SseA